MAKKIKEILTEKYPTAVERAKTSRSTAIKLFCMECCGGSRAEAKKCTATECFLYPFSPAASVNEDDEEKSSEKASAARERWNALSEEEKAERVAKLKAGRAKGASDDEDDLEEAADDTE